MEYTKESIHEIVNQQKEFFLSQKTLPYKFRKQQLLKLKKAMIDHQDEIIEALHEDLGRSDVVYRDVRLLEDTATWENKGGDRYLSGYIKRYEVIPSPFLANYTVEYI